MTTATPARPFDRTPPAELTPTERAAALATLLAAGLLRHLHPAAFPPPGRRHEFAGKTGETTC